MKLLEDPFSPRLLELALAEQERYSEALIIWPYTWEISIFVWLPSVSDRAVFDQHYLPEYLASDMRLYVWNKLLPRLYGLCYGIFYHLLAHGWNYL